MFCRAVWQNFETLLALSDKGPLLQTLNLLLQISACSTLTYCTHIWILICNLKEFINKHSTLSCYFSVLQFLGIFKGTINFYVHLHTVGVGAKRITGNQPRQTKLYFGRTLINLGWTNFNLNFTGIGHDVQWFPPCIGHAIWRIGRTIWWMRWTMPCPTNILRLTCTLTKSWWGKTKCYKHLQYISTFYTENRPTISS